ncbi:hypothetical protein SAMN05880582_101223 [Rhizobium sp. RU20A]|uniref:hypothetical protein n=1 Tax=Rhizobium sp. RU20A TaxID=1907412 RepID=UPI000953E45A|nr:hypothetical protein [Rhizobium sp. RU20A]SIP97270.1 hypothetical protein SAMN05880582_101223 [Rhizobium sp. RU20A]
MRLAAVTCLALLTSLGGAFAQETSLDAASGESQGNTGMTVGVLVSEGYEIRAAVRHGDRTIVFLQKDKSAYACDFATLAQSRCGSIN